LIPSKTSERPAAHEFAHQAARYRETSVRQRPAIGGQAADRIDVLEDGLKYCLVL